MTTINAKVTKTECLLQMDGELTSGMVGVPISFEFTPEWKELKKTAVFYAGTVKRDRINIERSTTVPAEVLQKPMENLYVGIYGYREDGTIVIPTVMAKVGMILRGANPSGDPGVDPDLPIWADLERRVSDLEDGNGDAAVKSVNGITPDENGNVEIKIPESSGSSVTIDPTLTKSGAAADAKAVGDAIANLDIPSIEGLATEEYVDNAIANIDFPSGGGSGAVNSASWVLLHDEALTEEVQSMMYTLENPLTHVKIQFHVPNKEGAAETFVYLKINNVHTNEYSFKAPHATVSKNYSVELEYISDGMWSIEAYSIQNVGVTANHMHFSNSTSFAKQIGGIGNSQNHTEINSIQILSSRPEQASLFPVGTRLRVWGEV